MKLIDKINDLQNSNNPMVLAKKLSSDIISMKFVYANDKFLKMKNISLKEIKQLKRPLEDLFITQNSESYNYIILNNIADFFSNNKTETSFNHKLASNDNLYIYNCKFTITSEIIENLEYLIISINIIDTIDVSEISDFLIKTQLNKTINAFPTPCFAFNEFMEVISINHSLITLLNLNYEQALSNLFYEVSTNQQKDVNGNLVNSTVLMKQYLNNIFKNQDHNFTTNWNFINSNNEIIQTKLTLSILNNVNNSTIVLCSIEDLSKVLEYTTKLKELEDFAYMDALCLVYNRRYFIQQFNDKINSLKLLKSSKLFSILMFDIDDFKFVNDTYGHDAGDYILKEFSSIINNTISKYGIFARYGGEEFIATIFSMDKKNLFKIAEKVRNDIDNANLVYKDFKIHITVSVGIAYSKNYNLKLEDLITYADKLLYDAKANGKNQVQIDSL